MPTTRKSNRTPRAARSGTAPGGVQLGAVVGTVLLITLLFTWPAAFLAAAEVPFREEAPGDANRTRVLLVPVLEATVSSEVEARIKSMPLDIGDHFSRGQTLVVFDDSVYQARRRKALADFNEARQVLAANRQLQTMQSISEIDVAVAEAKRDRAKAELDLTNAWIEKCTLYAPFSGRVIQRRARPFEYITGGQPLLDIIDNINIQAKILIPSRWLSWIRKGAAIDMHVDETQKAYRARIKSLGAKVDPVSQTLEIRAVIDGRHPELLAGMSGTALFTPPPGDR